MKSTGYLLLQDEMKGKEFNVMFQDLRTDEELFDVTLASDDGTVEAHKVVISASSLFFRNVFKNTKQPHPFIYLRGVHHQDLVALLDYIYTGKTQILAEDVNRFLSVAKDLKIKSLTEEEEIPDNTINESVMEALSPLHEVADDLSPEVVLKEASEEVTTSNQTLPKLINEEKSSDQLKKKILDKIEKVFTDSEGGFTWKCTDCGRTKKNKFQLGYHVETHLEGFSHNCAYCGKAHKTRGALSGHISFAHKDIKGKDVAENEEVEKTKIILANSEGESDTDDAAIEVKQEKMSDGKNLEQLRTEISERMEKVVDEQGADVWKCTVCGKIFKKKTHAKSHVEIHLEGFSHVCVHCEKTHKTRAALSVHMSYVHKGLK